MARSRQIHEHVNYKESLQETSFFTKTQWLAILIDMSWSFCLLWQWNLVKIFERLFFIFYKILYCRDYKAQQCAIFGICFRCAFHKPFLKITLDSHTYCGTLLDLWSRNNFSIGTCTGKKFQSWRTAEPWDRDGSVQNRTNNLSFC